MVRYMCSVRMCFECDLVARRGQKSALLPSGILFGTGWFILFAFCLRLWDKHKYDTHAKERFYFGRWERERAMLLLV